MVILDTTIVNVATLNIREQLGADTMGLQWVLDGYTLAFASFLLTAGALGDRFGSRHMYLVGLALFTIASALCGIAPSLLMLQIARIIQGFGAAFLVPTSLALLSHSFPGSQERARAIGAWGAIAGIAAASGPVIGGFLVNVLSWRSVFLVNVPIGILCFLLTSLYVPLTPRLPRRNLDIAAQVAAIIALGALTFALIEGAAWGWSSSTIIGMFVIFMLATVVFIVVERHVAQPMLPLDLFASRTFSASNTVGLLLNFGFYGQLFFLPLFFQQVHGYSPFATGLALLPESGVVLISSFLAGRVTGRFGPRLPMVIGLAAGCAGFLSMTLTNAATGYLVLLPMLVAMGFGISFTMPAMTAAVIESAPRERSGIASAVLNASRQVGSVLGVALLGSFVGNRSMFIPGMHGALLLAGAAFLVGCILSLFAV
jgi:DHA2 family methylenomycin A resistance protein-like MFS transporter